MENVHGHNMDTFNNLKGNRSNLILTIIIIIIVILIIIFGISLLIKGDKEPSLVLDTNRINLSVGDMYEIKYKLKNISDVDIKYSSKNVSVAVVSNSGAITAVSKGSTYIIMNYSLKDGSSYSNLIFVTVS